MQSKIPDAASSSGRGDAGTLRAASEVLSGKSEKGFVRRILPFIGPAFIACVAYIDPGNFIAKCREVSELRTQGGL